MKCEERKNISLLANHEMQYSKYAGFITISTLMTDSVIALEWQAFRELGSLDAHIYTQNNIYLIQVNFICSTISTLLYVYQNELVYANEFN